MTDLFTNPLRYGDLDDWHRSVDALRAGGPIQWVDQSDLGFTPFWAVIGHEQVMAIERQPELFTNDRTPCSAGWRTSNGSEPVAGSFARWCRWTRRITRSTAS